MSALLAFMLIVSCSDGYKDCAAADIVRPFPSQAACEAQLEPALRRFYAARPSQAAPARYETALARCVSSESLTAGAANDNSALGAYGVIPWQVSAAGDLLIAAANDSAEKSAAANIGARGVARIDYSADLSVAIAAAAAEQKMQEAAKPAAFHRSLLTLYSKYKSQKQKRAQPARTKITETALAGYSPHYLYETAKFGQAFYADLNMNIVWGRSAPLSFASFEIERPKEQVYQMPAQEAAALRGELSGQGADAELPASAVRPDMFDNNTAPGGGDAAKTRATWPSAPVYAGLKRHFG